MPEAALPIAPECFRLSLRSAQVSDEPFLKEVYSSTRSDLEGVPWSQEERSAFLTFQSAAQERHYHNSHPTLERLLIEQDGVPVGRLYRAVTAAEHRVLDVALLPGFRGRGLGTQLLQAETERAQAAGAVLRLHVECNNPARRLYERLGFVLEDDQGLYLAMKRLPTTLP